jgi:NADH-quinone oxidoreductase subunit I
MGGAVSESAGGAEAGAVSGAGHAGVVVDAGGAGDAVGVGAAGVGAAGELPARSRGVIGLLEENCTVCMLCARECPDWCIYIESHKEPVPVDPGPGGPGDGGSAGPGRAPAGRGRRVRNALDRFAIDFSLCMYCGICIEVCPYDALFWSPEFSYPAGDIRGLTHERDRLREWMWTVPPPPTHDPGAPPARELLAAGEPGEAADGVAG